MQVKKMLPILVILVITFLISNQKVFGGQPDEVRVMVKFSGSMSVKEALIWSKQNDLKPMQLVHSFQLFDKTYMGGYIIHEGQTMKECIDNCFHDLKNMYKSILKENENALESPKFDLGIGEIEDLYSLTSDLHAIIKMLEYGDIQIDAVDFKTDYSKLEKVSESEYVQLIQIRGGYLNNQATLKNDSGEENMCVAEWWPNNGYVSVQPSGTTRRYVYQSFNWDENRLYTLNLLNSYSTYEPEAWFYNYDGEYYLGNTVSWSSNLPSSYSDTEFANSNTERGYTVGTADASSLNANTSYYTMIYTDNGNSTSDTGKINGQRGHRWPSYCYSTWCVWPDETERIVEAWEIQAPGQYWWNH